MDDDQKITSDLQCVHQTEFLELRKEIKEIRLILSNIEGVSDKVSTIESSLAMILSKLDSEKPLKFEDCKGRVEKKKKVSIVEADRELDQGKKACVDENNSQSTRALSPFINCKGSLFAAVPSQCIGEGLGTASEEIDKGKANGIHSFSLSSIRFNQSQFPPGLETLMDVETNDTFIKKKGMCKKTKSPPISLRTPKSMTPTTKTPAIDSDEKTTVMSSRKKKLQFQETHQKRENVGKGALDIDHDEEIYVPLSEVKRRKQRTSKSQSKKAQRNNDGALENGSPSEKEDDEEGILSQMNNDKAKSHTDGGMNYPAKALRLRSLQNCYSDDENRAKTKETCDLQQPLFHDYLDSLSSLEKHICINAHKENKSFKFYGPENPMISLTIGECQCVYPDGWISDHFLNAYLYDLQLGLIENESSRMIVSTAFQVLVLKSDCRNPHSGSQSRLLYCSNLNDTFVPDHLYKIDEVLIPVFDLENKHWFLLITNLEKDQVYIIDSLGVSDNRYTLATDMMRCASKNLRRNCLGKLFENDNNFAYHIVKVKVQPNGHDCGMYVIKYIEKYIECGSIEGIAHIFYSTDEMRLERLKCLAKLAMSCHNSFDNLSTLIGSGNHKKI